MEERYFLYKKVEEYSHSLLVAVQVALQVNDDNMNGYLGRSQAFTGILGT